MDRWIGDLAGRQHGVVAIEQLLALGIRRDEIEYRIRTGRLVPVHRGVYAVGHGDLSRHGRLMAATLIAPGAAASHRSGLEIWRMANQTGGGIHITAPRRTAKRPGIVVHRRALPADEVTTRFGIPVTTVARTLLDTAAAEGRSALERGLRKAHNERLADPVGLPALIERYPGARGTAVARAVLADGAYAKRTRSDLEDDYLEWARGRRLPLPETNAIVEVAGRRFEVDGIYRAARVVLELDAAGTHGAWSQRERDLERDGLLQAHGYSVHRVTSRRMDRDGEMLELQLRRALGLPRAA